MYSSKGGLTSADPTNGKRNERKASLPTFYPDWCKEFLKINSFSTLGFPDRFFIVYWQRILKILEIYHLGHKPGKKDDDDWCISHDKLPLGFVDIYLT